MVNFRDILTILLILGLFIGATVEISEGITYVGVFLFILLIILLSRIQIVKKKTKEIKALPSAFYLQLLGIAIILADLGYNLRTNSTLGTLDMMTFLLGVSLIAQGIKREDIRKMGIFGTYMSATFIVLFLIFFSLFNKLNIDFIHIFDHYVVLLPTVSFIRLLGIPIEVIGIETIYMRGVEDMSVIIGGPCSGLYSMFLLLSTVVAYTRIEKVKRNGVALLLGLSIVIAYIANFTRVSLLYIVGYYYGRDVMMLVHAHLGWIIFIVVVMLIFPIIKRFEVREVRADGAETKVESAGK